MKREFSLPRSQEPATCPYYETDQSSPCPAIPVLEDPFHYYPPIYAWVFQVIFSSDWTHQNLVFICYRPSACRTRHPFHSSWFDDPNNIWWGVQIIKLLIMQVSPFPFYLLPPESSAPYSESPQPTLVPQREGPICTPIPNNLQNYISLYLIFIFLDLKLETQIFCMHSLNSVCS